MRDVTPTGFWNLLVTGSTKMTHLRCLKFGARQERDNRPGDSNGGGIRRTRCGWLPRRKGECGRAQPRCGRDGVDGHGPGGRERRRPRKHEGGGWAREDRQIGTSPRPNGYRRGSYRIATAPEPNSSRLTSLKSIRCANPANKVGPWPASTGMHHELMLINQSQLRQRERELYASHEQSLTRLPLELLNGRPQIPAHEFRIPIDPVQRARHDVRFFAASIVRAKGSIQSGLAPVRAGGHHAASIISYVTRPKRSASARLRFSMAFRCKSSAGGMTR